MGSTPRSSDCGTEHQKEKQRSDRTFVCHIVLNEALIRDPVGAWNNAGTLLEQALKADELNYI